MLVIEDEPSVQEALVSFLRYEGMFAHGVGTLAQADSWILENDFDILLLDLGMPDGDGIEWLRQHQDLRDKGLIITTARSDALSRINGVRAGADTYLVKPVLPEEIASLISNLMRRLHSDADTSAAGWVIEHEGWQLIPPNGPSVKLTHNEYLLLLRLAQAHGEAVSREDLALCLGYDPKYYDYRRLEVLVRRLRNKAKEHIGQPLPLQTAHRHGFAFSAAIRAR